MRRPLDDNGNRCTLHDLDNATRDRAVRIRNTQRNGLRGFGFVFVIEILIVACVAAVLGVFARRIWTSNPLPVGVFTGLLIGPASVVLMRRDTVRRFRERRTVALRERLCPACWYSLEDAEPLPDGHTVCPECGAAWRLGDIENE